MKKLYMTILIIVTIFCVIFGTVYHVGRFISFTGRTLHGLETAFDEMEEEAVTKTYDLADKGNIQSLDLDMEIGDVTIEAGDSYDVVWVGTQRSCPEVITDDGTLKIRQKSRMDIQDAFAGKRRLTVTIPSGTALKKLDVKMDMGNCTVSSVTAAEAEVRLSKGNLTLTDASFGELDAKADMGNVDLENVRAATAGLEANMGNLSVDGLDDFSELKVKADLGNVDLNLSQSEAELSFDLDADLGSVHLNGQKLSSSVDRGAGSAKIKVNADLGSIHIKTAG